MTHFLAIIRNAYFIDCYDHLEFPIKTLASSSPSLPLTYTSFLMRGLIFIIWLHIMTLEEILNLNSYNFRENFPFTSFAPNNLFKLSQISLDDFSIYIYIYIYICNSHSERAWIIMSLDLSSLLYNSSDLNFYS
jgi:hypothetical protein